MTRKNHRDAGTGKWTTAETVAETVPTRHETPDVAELRRWLGDMQSLAERDGIYDGNASVRSIVARVVPLLDRLAHMTEARDNARAEVERLRAHVEMVEAVIARDERGARAAAADCEGDELQIAYSEGVISTVSRVRAALTEADR